jgi:3-oxoacyl-(acyl-carrier-protein) synthase
MQSGCVQYSCRFLEETVKDPATASPLVFPETVFAAPTSHVATLLGGTPLATTLVGDPACFLQGLALAADWLEGGEADTCLVLGSEESHWLLADALHHFQPPAVFTCGAGAVCLTNDPARSIGVELERITDAHTFSPDATRTRAAAAMRAQLPKGAPEELLCDGLDSCPRTDAPERAAWRNWPGARLSPKRILGEGLMAAAAWQCVLACAAVASGDFPAATVSLVGNNQQAIGARFRKA